jgi:hypothetical protein
LGLSWLPRERLKKPLPEVEEEGEEELKNLNLNRREIDGDDEALAQNLMTSPAKYAASTAAFLFHIF